MIRELRIQCIVGVLPAERVTPQEVVVSLDVGTDVARAARTGELDHTIDYAALAEQVRALVVAGRYRLLETMAEDLARCVLQSMLAAEVRVTIRKPAAIAAARDAGVEIVRTRATPRPAILGVVNLSPESNVPGSHATGLPAVRARAARLCADGADYVELGARSISPDRPHVNEAEEWRRLQPALEALVAGGYRVAVDTWSEPCAERALDHGAGFINFTGAMPSAALCTAAARRGATLCVLYLPYPDPYTMRDCPPVAYGGGAILDYFREALARARHAGLQRVVLDPNVGILHPTFDAATKIAYQIQAISALPAVAALGAPTLAYLARKKELSSRLLIAAQLAAAGVDYVRAHEPALALQAWAVWAALPVAAAGSSENRARQANPVRRVSWSSASRSGRAY